MGQIVLTIAGIALAALLVLAGARLLERALLYAPDAERRSPSDFGLPDVEEQIEEMPDGTRLVIWHAPAQGDNPTILYFQGNAGHLGDRADRARAMLNRGFGIHFMAYRGFSGSGGSPTEKQNVADARQVYRRLITNGLRPEELIIYGESLGSGVAVQLAVDGPAAGLILDAPYTSIVDIGARLYPYLPVRLMMRDRYESRRWIDQLHLPILIIHGEKDTVVPVEMGRTLARMAGDTAQLRTFPEAGHWDHYAYGSFAVMADWIKRQVVRKTEMNRDAGSANSRNRH